MFRRLRVAPAGISFVNVCISLRILIALSNAASVVIPSTEVRGNPHLKKGILRFAQDNTRESASWAPLLMHPCFLLLGFLRTFPRYMHKLQPETDVCTETEGLGVSKGNASRAGARAPFGRLFGYFLGGTRKYRRRQAPHRFLLRPLSMGILRSLQ